MMGYYEEWNERESRLKMALNEGIILMSKLEGDISSRKIVLLLFFFHSTHASLAY